jgi:threonine synthase
VKTLFADAEFNATHRLGAINSINWARILAQIVYYFHAYLHLPEEASAAAAQGDLHFVVPTGNFGDVLAGWYAKRLGLPMGQLVVATNENDILTRFWQTGRYEKMASAPSAKQAPATEVVEGSSDGAQSGGGVKETLSPAMDILVSSNFERLLFYLAYDTQAVPSAAGSGDSAPIAAETEGAGKADDAMDRVRRAQAMVAGWMGELKSTGRVDLSGVLGKAKEDFLAERVSDEEVSRVEAVLGGC